MNDVIFLGKGVFSQGLYVVRPKVPLLTIGRIFSSNEALIVSYRQKYTVFALSLTVIDSGLVL